MISFLPPQGKLGPSVNADIIDGHYHVTTETGPVAGPHRITVKVESTAGADKLTVDPAKKGGDLRQWQFQYEVPSEGPVTHNLTLNDV
ncbi:MAG: hypothetical protein R3C10_08265 [Pirellulales bacterium]|nr:hypothetical protein [Planctomycetales bacterium]